MLAGKAISFQSLLNASSQDTNSQMNISNSIPSLGIHQQTNNSHLNYSNHEKTQSLMKTSPHNIEQKLNKTDSMIVNGSFNLQNNPLHSSPSTSSFISSQNNEQIIERNTNTLIQKSKEVKPRKRSQHTKGNKLWEFIRDALRDPITNPSIVK